MGGIAVAANCRTAAIRRIPMKWSQRMPLSTREEMKEAIAAAKAAFPAWRDMPLLRRAAKFSSRQIRSWRNRKQQLAIFSRAKKAKHSKILWAKWQGDQYHGFYGRRSGSPNGETLRANCPRILRTRSAAAGCRGRNLPLEFSGCDSRLENRSGACCGNTVVFKPATLTPFTAMSLSLRFSSRRDCRRAC